MNRVNPRLALLARSMAVAVLGLALAACSPKAKSGESKPAPSAEAQTVVAPAETHRYELKGAVVSVDKAAKTLVVNHENIPGFMGAMTMPYKVKDERSLVNLAPGQHVTATVVFTGREFWLEDLVSVAPRP